MRDMKGGEKPLAESTTRAFFQDADAGGDGNICVDAYVPLMMSGKNLVHNQQEKTTLAPDIHVHFGFKNGDKVRIIKEGSRKGHTAVVSHFAWHEMIKVRDDTDGSIVTYTSSQIESI